jgi:hypothetical protein
MKKLSTCARVATVCGLIAALLGCGGGSSNSAPAVPNSVTIGQLGGSYGAVGQSITVNWSNTQAVACTGSGALSGSLTASGTQAVTLTTEGTTTFTVTCGTASQSESIQTLPQYTTINDPVFEQALVAMGIDDVVDGKVLTANVLKVTKMAILGGAGYQTAAGVQTAATGNAFITDATGLENFKNLTYLRFEQQKVTSFNVAPLTDLTYISLWQEPITTLDLSHNTRLETVGLSETALTTVDLSTLAALSDLEIQANEALQGAVYAVANGTTVVGFSSLDVTHNPKLTTILAFGNHITSVDLSKNTALTNAGFAYNKLTKLTVAGLATLDALDVDHNQLTNLDIAGTTIGQLSGPQSLNTNGNAGLTSITVTNAAQMTTWCSNAVTAIANNSGAYGVCAIDSTTTFVSGS